MISADCKYLKQNYQNIKNTYFYDGCVAHHKNCKDYMNFYQLFTDFNLKENGIFLESGKSAFDGIWGTIKQLNARSSIQRLFNN